MASFVLTFSSEPVDETNLPNISSAVFGISFMTALEAGAQDHFNSDLASVTEFS